MTADALLLFPLGLAAITFAVARHREENRKVPEDERFAEDIRSHGFAAAWRSWLARHFACRMPLDQARSDRAAEASRRETRFDNHGKPLIDAHKHLVAYLIPILSLAGIGIVLFVIHVQLETGLVKTLFSNDASKAVLLGTIIAVFTTLLGGTLLEFVLPGKGLTVIKEMARPQRLGCLAGLAAAFVTVLALLPQLAMTRADTLYGDTLVRERAICAQVRADPSVTEAARTVACGQADSTAKKRERARTWDTVVSVAAPLGEAAGIWGLMRLAEIAVAGALGAYAERGRRRARTAAHAVEQSNAEFEALARRAAELAGLAPAAFDGLIEGGVEGPEAEPPRVDGEGGVIGEGFSRTDSHDQGSEPDEGSAGSAGPQHSQRDVAPTSPAPTAFVDLADAHPATDVFDRFTGF